LPEFDTLRLAVKLLARLTLIVSPATAGEIWLIGGVPDDGLDIHACRNFRGRRPHGFLRPGCRPSLLTEDAVSSSKILIASVLTLLGCASVPGGISTVSAAPTDAVWFSPVGGSPDILDLFAKPDLWSTARSHVNVFKFEPFQVDAKKSDSPTAYQSLKGLDAFGKLKKWAIDIAIEVPAVKEWDCSGRGDTKDQRVRGDAKATTLGYVRNVYDAGGKVKFLAMDEPLVNGLGACKGSLEETAEKTAYYAKAILKYRDVKTWAPSLAIGDIEPYPSRSVAQLKQWTKALESNGFKPSFFHLDVDVNDVDVRGPKLDMAGELRDLKAFFKGEGIPFGVIFWSGHDPESTDAAYYNHTMSWVNRVHAAIGKPEQSIFQSWVRRSSINCTGTVSCSAKNNFMCSPADPPYCGRGSMPINLPDNNPKVFSHTRLINDGLAVLGPG
jgi:hypothetical protein